MACRLCLAPSPVPSSPLAPLLPLVSSTLGPEVTQNLSGEPGTICGDCILTLESFGAFKTKVLNNLNLVRDTQDISQANGKERAKLTSPKGIKSEAKFIVETMEVKENMKDEVKSDEYIADNSSDDGDEIMEDNFDVKFEEEVNELFKEEVEEAEKPKKKRYPSQRKRNFAQERIRYERKTGFCDICQKQYTDINAHKSNFHNRQEMKCTVCDKVCLGIKLLKTHMTVHTAQSVPCPECGKLIKETAMRKHLAFVHKKADIPCTYPECKLLFKQPQTLKNHIRTVHLGETKLCPHCGEESANLWNHMQKCEQNPNPIDKTNLTCQFCQKVCASATNKKIHERDVHIEPDNFKTCNICGKSVKNFYGHMKNMHSPVVIKPFECDAEGCGKSFKQSSELKQHMTSVHLKTRGQCEECGKWYCVKQLRVHMREMHEGRERIKHQCTDCNSSFLRPWDLRLHVERVHMGIRYPCPECGKSVSKLAEHMKCVHGLSSM